MLNLFKAKYHPQPDRSLNCAHRIGALLVLLCFSLTGFAQPADDNTQAEPDSVEVLAGSNHANLKQLRYIQSVLDSKLLERRKLGDDIALANEQDKADLRRNARILTTDIAQLRNTIETLATGGVDRKLFEQSAEKQETDWREDVSLIAQPVLDSLKEITEKPRKIKELNELIELKQEEISVSSNALDKLAEARIDDKGQTLFNTIQGLTNKWQKRKDDAQSTIEIARIQLNSLDGDQPLSSTIYAALVKFAKGRGLTIVMAIVAAWLVWFVVRMLLKTYRHTLLDRRQPDSRTRYRVAKYSVQALTFTLVLIAVFIVFYERHDVLLLGLLILLIVGFVLNAKQLLPRYVKEARLLLNLGAMREGERVIYNDLPYRVESINMYTKLANPELDGVLRIPLAELTQITSRPVTNDTWFPSSQGDVMLTSDGTLLRVLSQNPDTVELMKRGGEQWSTPTAQFYTLPMTNLSRPGTFGVTEKFGVDYLYQRISATEIPSKLQEGIEQAFTQSRLRDAVKDVQVELAEAGDSSINYWIFVTMDSAVAFSYFGVQRLIQSACIATCSSNGWSIPFPHMALVQKDISASNDLQDPANEMKSASG